MPHAKHLRRPSNALRRSIAVALGVALISASTMAGAETAKEQELEARVAQLEQLVQQLVAEKKAAPAAAGTVAAAPATAPAKPIQPGTILPNAAPGTSFVLTGYAKVDGMWTDTSDGELAENTPSRDFYVPGATPIGQPDEGTDFDAHAKQTRINFGTDTLLAEGDKLSTRFEIDFFGSITGDQRIPTPTRRCCGMRTCNGASGSSARPRATSRTSPRCPIPWTSSARRTARCSCGSRRSATPRADSR
jgi:hypothetical protein